LKKATKLTSQVMDQNTQIQLYHEILNSYVYFFNQNHPDVSFVRLIIFSVYNVCLSFRSMCLY